MRCSFFLFLLFCSCTYNELIPVCEPDEETFSELVKPIIENNCIGCHSESSGRPAILTTYDGVIEAINIYSLDELVVDLQMPPSGSPALTESDINIIENWADCE